MKNKIVSRKRNKLDGYFIAFIALCLWLALALAYTTAQAGVIDWLLGGTREVVLLAPEVPKTLDSEIDRLSTKYEVASSTARAIIKCESTMYAEAINRNRLSDGTVWSSDFGYWQINDYYHEQTMRNLGLDIHNSADSLEYGFVLFKSQGTAPWSASKVCWSKLVTTD